MMSEGLLFSWLCVSADYTKVELHIPRLHGFLLHLEQ